MRLVALSLLLVLLPGAGSTNRLGAVEQRIVAIGDIHGAYDEVVAILREAGLIGTENEWIGDQATLVQTGDFLDRGARVREVMDLLMSLQLQAKAKGGRALILLGNHEIFNLTGDLADAAPGAFAAFADSGSETRRQTALEDYQRWSQRQSALLVAAQIPAESEAEWLLRHPPGLLEYLEAIGPGGRYGRWLRSLLTVVRIDDTLFLHGGLAPELALADEDSINRQVAEEIERVDDCRARLIEEGLILRTSSSLETVKIVAARLRQLQDEIQVLAKDGGGRSRTTERARRRQHARLYECVADYDEWLLNDDRGPQFFRGHALGSDDEARSDLARVLAGWRATRLVVGHTTMADGRIRDRFDGLVFFIDTGMLSEFYSGGRASALEITSDRQRKIYLAESEEPSQSPSSVVEGPGLYESHDILSVSLEAPLSRLLRQPSQIVNGTLKLEKGGSLAVELTTSGKSRLRGCELPPLKMTVPATERLAPFDGLSPLRVVTHCQTQPSLERYTILEYLIYRSYSLLSKPALRVRLARITYLDTDRPGRAQNAYYGFFVEDIGVAAARSSRSWLSEQSRRLSDLDPTQTALVALFQYMVGNTDWSALEGPEGERCCHNAAVLGDDTASPYLLLPFDFDQSGLVNAPYAVPDPSLGSSSVRQRRYRGFCAHNDQLPDAIEKFKAQQAELESLFNDESLPYPKVRSAAWKYVTRFFDEISDPEKLEKRIVRACR